MDGLVDSRLSVPLRHFVEHIFRTVILAWLLATTTKRALAARAGADVEQVIEMLAGGSAGGANVAAEVLLREHAIELGLREPQPTVDRFADVLKSPGFRIAAEVDADQPCAGSAAIDLASLVGHNPS